MPEPCSLLIPCFNAARFLPALFEGIRRQTLPFAEIILWDDSSTDGSGDIAARLGARVVRSEKSVGPATARNELVRMAQHQWVHLHDADDLISADYLAVMADEAKSDVDVVACDADWIDEHSRERVIAWRYSEVEYARNPTAYLLSHPLGINNCLYRREEFLARGGYRPHLVPWEDSDYHIRLAASGCQFRFVPRVLTQSVRHAAGISMDYRRNWRARLRCLEEYAQIMPVSLHPTLALEAERTASELAGLRDAGAAEAIALCRHLGGNPPTTRNPVTKLIKAFVPTETLLRWQRRWRHAAQAIDR